MRNGDTQAGLPPPPSIGSVVRLKRGLVDMVVENYEAGAQQLVVTCVWQTKDGHPMAAKYLLSSLMLVIGG